MQKSSWVLLVASVAVLAVMWVWRGQPRATVPTVDTLGDALDSIDSADSIVGTASQETFVYWFDDIQDVSPFDTNDRSILPDSQACRWVLANRDKAADELRTRIASRVELGNAILGAALGLTDMLPTLIDGWIKIDEEPYNGESPTPANPSLVYFREMQGIAFAIEKLAGKPINEAVQLSAEQRQDLTQRAADGGAAAKMILATVRQTL